LLPRFVEQCKALANVMQGLKTCRFPNIELEAQIGEGGFQVCNSSIQLVSLNFP